MVGTQARAKAGWARTARGSSSPIPAARKILARQVEPSDQSVLVEIAQNIGELQGAAQMMRKTNAFRLGHPKSAGGQAADRARHPVAIKIERRKIGRPDIGLDIHLHSIDHGAKILLPEAEGLNGLAKTAQQRIGRTLAGVKPVDIAPPFGEGLPAAVTRARFVRDIVDGAAKGVNFKHRLAARARQNPHRRIERAAAGAGGHIGLGRRTPQAGHAGHASPVRAAGSRRGRK